MICRSPKKELHSYYYDMFSDAVYGRNVVFFGKSSSYERESSFICRKLLFISGNDQRVIITELDILP